MRFRGLAGGCFAAALFASPAFAGFSPGIEVGWSRTSALFQVPSVEWQDPQTGNALTAGLTLRVAPWTHVGFRFGVSYQQQSVRVDYARSPGYWDTYEGEFQIEGRYVRLPFCLEARPARSQRFFLSLGPELSFLREGHFEREETWTYGSGGTATNHTDEDRTAEMKSTEWGVQIGAGLDLPTAGHWTTLELRYTAGFTGVGDMRLYGPWESDWRNRALEAIVGARW